MAGSDAAERLRAQRALCGQALEDKQFVWPKVTFKWARADLPPAEELVKHVQARVASGMAAVGK
jgi:hypothetical protein